MMGQNNLIINVICVNKVMKEMRYWYVMGVNCMHAMRDVIQDTGECV